MSALPSGIDNFRAEFERVEGQLPGADLPRLREVRRQAMTVFSRQGFPTRKDEHWKYTSVAAIAQQHFRPSLASDNALDANALAPFRLADAVCELVFVNAHYCADLSRVSELPQGLHVDSLAALLQRGNAELAEQFNALGDAAHGAFSSLNTAFAGDGAFIKIADDVTLDRPVHILHMSTAANGGQVLASFARHVLQAGRNTKAQVVASYHALGDAKNLNNVHTALLLDDGAQLEFYKLQDEAAGSFHVEQIEVQQGPDSRLVSFSIALGAALARTDIQVRLGAPGAEAELNGLYMGCGDQVIDHHLRVDHLQPHTRSTQCYKGILDDQARGIFNGKVVVAPQAQKTDAQQSNHNLLLSPRAEADTKPELEIYADDVKCSHGATVGQLDTNALFYLRSRGLDLEQARNLLIYAFAEDIVSRIALDTLRRRIEATVISHLKDSDRLLELA